MYAISRATAVFIVACFLAACAPMMQVGRYFEISGFQAKIQVGTTTREQVRAWLGELSGVGNSFLSPQSPFF